VFAIFKNKKNPLQVPLIEGDLGGAARRRAINNRPYITSKKELAFKKKLIFAFYFLNFKMFNEYK